MTDAADDIQQRVLDLKRSFDENFAAAPKQPEGGQEDLLIIGVGQERYALRIAELSGIEARRRIVPLPADRPGLIGLAGIMGRLAPVFALSSLLGQGREAETPWLAVCGREAPIALAFSRLHGHACVPRHDRHAASAGDELRPHVREAVRIGGRSIFVLETSSLVRAVLPHGDASQTTEDR